MKLSELINHVGDENIKVQYVDHFITAKNKKKTKDTEVTFATKETTVDELMGRRPRNLGLIIWLPMDKISKFFIQ